MKNFIIPLMIFGFVGAVQLANATKVEQKLTAIDSESFIVGANHWASYGDNIVRVYSQTEFPEAFDGFMKFDLSSIPDKSHIKSMTLTTFFAWAWGTPYGDPIVSLYRSANDLWSRGYTENSVYPGIDELLTDFHTGFPSTDLIGYDWPITVKAANWSTDLTDNILSLAMHIENPSQYCYVYFYGSDKNPAPPTLTIEYTVPEPSTEFLLGWGFVGLFGFRIIRGQKRMANRP